MDTDPDTRKAAGEYPARHQQACRGLGELELERRDVIEACPGENPRQGGGDAMDRADEP